MKIADILFKNNVCYLCHCCIEKSHFICQKCSSYFLSYRYEQCARCGQEDCSLMCENLIEFTNVWSLFKYQKELADILTLSKDNDNINAQRLLKEILGKPVSTFLLEKIQEHQYTDIVFSPLRRERIFYGPWHSHLFLDNILKFLKNNYNFTFCLHHPHFLNTRKRQARLEKSERFPAEIQLEKIFFVNQDILLETTQKKRILLLDDVLTTGNTAQSTYYFLQEHTAFECFDLFTIFRS
jgi:predicted amidophosphoribosyltransferase